MKILRLMDWWLDNLLSLNNQDFTDDIKTLPLHFKFHQLKLFYNDGKELDRDSKKIFRCHCMSSDKW